MEFWAALMAGGFTLLAVYLGSRFSRTQQLSDRLLEHRFEALRQLAEGVREFSLQLAPFLAAAVMGPKRATCGEATQEVLRRQMELFSKIAAGAIFLDPTTSNPQGKTIDDLVAKIQELHSALLKGTAEPEDLLPRENIEPATKVINEISSMLAPLHMRVLDQLNPEGLAVLAKDALALPLRAKAARAARAFWDGCDGFVWPGPGHRA